MSINKKMLNWRQDTELIPTGEDSEALLSQVFNMVSIDGSGHQTSEWGASSYTISYSSYANSPPEEACFRKHGWIQKCSSWDVLSRWSQPGPHTDLRGIFRIPSTCESLHYMLGTRSWFHESRTVCLKAWNSISNLQFLSVKWEPDRTCKLTQVIGRTHFLAAVGHLAAGSFKATKESVQNELLARQCLYNVN